MKKVLSISTLFCLIGVFAFGQGWDVEGVFPDTSGFPPSYGQGLAVDGEGKIWYTPYYSSDSIGVDTTGDGTIDEYQSTRAIYVYNSDGTPASFSPIKTITVDGVEDTLWNSNRGLRRDANGDIIAASWDVYYRINHLTGEGMAKLLPYPDETTADLWDGQTVVAAGVTDANDLITYTVLPNFPIKLYDSDWELIDEVLSLDYHPGYARTGEISADGNVIYYSSFSTGAGVVRFHSNAGVDGDYTTEIDTIMPGLAVEACSWQPVTGYFWGGNTEGSGWTNTAFYGYDPVSEAVVDSFIIPGVADLGAKPRGIDFSSDGETAYVTFFNTWDSHAIYKLTKSEVGIWEFDRIVPAGFHLNQNYPNPFNPTTTISYDLKEGGFAKLIVYDMVGREVAVLVDEPKSAGYHRVLFDASGLPSGMYIYQLEFKNRTVSKRMTYVK